jgi:hypothetical protein
MTVRGVGDNRTKYYLKNYLGSLLMNFIGGLKKEISPYFDYKDEVFNMIYDMCIMCDVYPKIYLDKGVFNKYKDEVTKSLLVSYVTY